MGRDIGAHVEILAVLVSVGIEARHVFLASTYHEGRPAAVTTARTSILNRESEGHGRGNAPGIAGIQEADLRSRAEQSQGQGDRELGARVVVFVQAESHKGHLSGIRGDIGLGEVQIWGEDRNGCDRGWGRLGETEERNVVFGGLGAAARVVGRMDRAFGHVHPVTVVVHLGAEAHLDVRWVRTGHTVARREHDPRGNEGARADGLIAPVVEEHHGHVRRRVIIGPIDDGPPPRGCGRGDTCRRPAGCQEAEQRNQEAAPRDFQVGKEAK